ALPGRPTGQRPAGGPPGGMGGSSGDGTGGGGTGGGPGDGTARGGEAASGRPRRIRLRFGDAKIRTKGILVLLLPGLVLGSRADVAVVAAVRSAASVASVERLARFGIVLSDAVDGLQHERDAAAIWLSAGPTAASAEVTRRVTRSDLALSRL